MQPEMGREHAQAEGLGGHAMRYFTTQVRPRSWHEYEPDVWAPRQPQAMTVIATDAIATGLVDQYGAEIMKSPEPIGFLK